jgi:AsmA protein
VGAGVLLGLFIVTVVLVVLFVDPNDYKDDIERLAEQQTGRQLELAGDLKLSVFPWLAIEFGPASLSDAPGFGDEPFVAVQHARLSVRFWPLLRGAIEIGDIRLDGVIVRLITDAAGRENWADLAATETDPGPETQPAGESLAMPTIAGLEIRDAAIVLEDRRDDSRLRILELNLETGRLKSGEPFELDSDFLLETANGLSASVSLTANVTADLAGNVHVVERPVIEATLRGEGMPAEGVVFKVRADNARIDVGQEQHTLEGLLAETAWRGEGFPAEGVPVTLRATALQADLTSQTLKVDGLDVDAAGARLTGALTGVEVLDAPRLEDSWCSRRSRCANGCRSWGWRCRSRAMRRSCRSWPSPRGLP